MRSILMSRSRFLLLTLAALAIPTLSAAVGAAPGAAASTAPAGVARLDDATLVRQLDALLQPVFAPDQPGAAVLVARNGKAIYRRGFGLADLEKKTAIHPEMSFRIGSVTKQFTSALVLRLVEQGKIGLQDDITKYLPDYPTQGKTITIENLLTHTSGIANYTDIPEFEAHMAAPMTHEQLIDLIKNKPLAFAPGASWAYSNSNYFLLGVIVEKVTGRSYAECLKSEFFGPLGMSHSGYGADEPSLPGEVRGYEMKAGKPVPADPLSMTTPYAAGAIVSSVDDLLKWDNGLNSGRILKQESLQRAFTPYTLKSGAATGYGYGWAVSSYEGHHIQEHNGGINGFLSHVTRLPDDHMYVALLLNNGKPALDPDFLALEIAAIAVGQPLPQPGAFTMTPAQLDRFVGVYALDSTTTRVISREGEKLYSQRSGGAKLEIFPTSDSTFAFVGRAAKLTFSPGAEGKTDRVTIIQSGVQQVFRKTDRPIPTAPQVVTLEPAQLDACVGQYELAPGFRIAITHEGPSLMAQATGQSKFEIFPKSTTSFFFKVVDAQVEFQLGADGKMASLVLHQAGHDTPGTRVP
jgi:CubicO group peptidase (beta-lactamase class C family)